MTGARVHEPGRMTSTLTPTSHHLLLALCISLLVPAQATANVYECQGQDGERVFTDDPKLFSHCKAMAIEPLPQPPTTPSRATPQPPPVQDTPPEASDPAPSTGQNQVSDPVASRQDPPSLPDPEYAPPPRVVQPQTHTCARDINRLNPFGSAPCQQSPGPPPTSVPYEDYYR